MPQLYNYCFLYNTNEERVHFVTRSHLQRQFNKETEGRTNIFYFTDYKVRKHISELPLSSKMCMFCVRDLQVIDNLKNEGFEIYKYEDQWAREYLRLLNRIYLMPVKTALKLIDVIADTEEFTSPDYLENRIDEISSNWNKQQLQNFLSGIKNKRQYNFDVHYQN